MSAGLGSFLAGVAGSVTKRAMAALGIGVVSYAGVAAALSSALSAAKAAWGGLAGEALQLVAMAGVNTAASILAGALVASVALKALKSFEVR